MRISINQVSSIGWSVEQDLQHWSEIGPRHVTLLGTKLAGHDAASLRRRIEALGARVVAFGTLGGLPLHDREAWPTKRTALERELETAGELGADHVVLLSGSGCGRPYAESESAFLACLDELLPRAERCGVALAFEPNQPLRVDLGFVHTFHDALDLADRIDSPHFQVCFEISNAWVERWLEQDIAKRVDRVGLVQISDVAEGTVTTPHRVPLGDGIIPLARILTLFERAGYEGCYDVEQLGPEIERLGYPESLRRSLAWLDAFNPD